jgi:hypothetical protein
MLVATQLSVFDMNLMMILKFTLKNEIIQ